jgi:protein SCO1
MTSLSRGGRGKHLAYRSAVGRAAASLVTAVVLAGFAAGCGGSANGSADRTVAANNAAQEAVALHGGVLRPPDAEPRLTFTDTAGSRYNVVRRTADKVMLLYFGYTHCPDVCPTTMADIAAALRQLSPQVRRKVAVVFVTVDPARDSRLVLRRWLDRFSHAFVGLRGSLHRVVAAERAASLPVSKVSRSGKVVEHAAQVLAYTPDHQAHVIYFDGPSTIDDLRHDLPILVSGEGFGA